MIRRGRAGAAIRVVALVALLGLLLGSLASNALPVSASGSAPTASAGGPYSIAEGDDVALSAAGSSDPETDPLTYAWDLDNDGQYDDAVGQDPTIPWDLLAELGVGDDGAHPIGVEVDDGTSTDSAGATLTITNTEPTITLYGPAAVTVGDPYRVLVEVDDPGADTVASWAINWGDGAVSTGTGAPDSQTHTYTVAGLNHDITIEVSDEDGSWISADLLVAHFDTTETVARFEAISGAPIADFASTGGALNTPYGSTIGPDGLLYVTGSSSANVVRFDPSDNSFVDTFVSPGSGGLSSPKGLAFGLDGNLYVSSYGTREVLRYNASDGTFNDVFIPDGTLSGPSGILFAPSGLLLVADQDDDNIEKYDATTGASLGVFSSLTPGAAPAGLAAGPAGNIFVAHHSGGVVQKLDPTGSSLGMIGGSELTQPHSLRIGPDGELWVTDYWTEEVHRFDSTTGAALGVRVTDSAPAGPFSLDFVPDLQVQVTAGLDINSSGDNGDASAGDGLCDTGGLNALGQPECTLRAAIEETNAASGPEIITFDLPVADAGHGAGVWTIAPTTPLPVISDPVVIDGTTQAGAAPATMSHPAAVNSSLTIELSGGAMASGSEGLDLNSGSSGSEVRGLAFTGFTGTGARGVRLRNTVGVVVVGNHLGASATGIGEAGNQEGIRIGGGAVDSRIGGSTAVDRNLFAAATDSHIGVVGTATGTLIQGNDFGFLAGGSAATSSPGYGILTWNGSSGTVIGGAGATAGNRIRGAGTGVGVGASTSDSFASVVGNRIWDNTGIGIDLDADGVTANDGADADAGPNDKLNFPMLTSANALSGSIDVTVDLDVPAGAYRIELFTNPGGVDDSGNGEGEILLVSGVIVHPGGGTESFTLSSAGALGDEITATATEIVGAGSYGSTSEFSSAVTATLPCTDTDGDGLCDLEEDANTDLDSNPVTNPGPDTDGDTTANYLDADDDGDGTPTALENADPNADGDPRDALDSDHDGQPDYLDHPTGHSGNTVATEQKISDTTGGLTAALSNSDELGRSVATIGDLDGDGAVDIAVGAHFDDDGGTNRGAVHILLLNPDGSVKAEQKISDTAGGLTAALGNDDEFGISVAGLGDIDGDGINDIAVGALDDDDGGSDRGALYILFLNADGTVRAEQKISDTAGGLSATLGNLDNFGRSIANIGDVNGDGINDIAVGAHMDDDGGSDRGAVHILFLNANGTVTAEQKISDGAGGLTTALDNNDRFGVSVAGIGDLDGDGLTDVAVGAFRDDDGGSDRGAVHILFLNADGTVRAEQKISDTAGGLSATLDNLDNFGRSVGAIGDVDDDGVNDVVVGTYHDDDGGTDRGAIHVLFLNTDGTVKAEQKISDTAGGLTAALDDGDEFGQSVAGLGDLDGDGTLGIAVGAEGDDDGGTGRGAVYVLDLSRSMVVVNSTGDSGDASPGDNLCDTGGTNSEGDPECTLRAAIQEANADPAVDTIHFAISTSDPGYLVVPGAWASSPGSPLPSVSATVTIDGTTQSGWVSTPVIEIDGSSAGAGIDGLHVFADDVVIRGLAINRFLGDGIEVDSTTTGAVIVGNHIGLDVTGLIDRGNFRGIDLEVGSGPSTVGGTTAADRNVISGNGSDGMILWGSNGNTIIGNFIGTDVTGSAAIPNDTDGIGLGNSASNNIIGQPGAGNILSGNRNDGIEIGGPGSGNVVEANHIGLGADGGTVVANGRYGVVLYDGANTNQIGGPGAGEGNVISGNTQSGLIIDANNNAATTANTIEGNHIGTDAGGTLARGNGDYGIHFFSGAHGNTIGGTTASHGNVISANGGGSHAGVYIVGATSSSNVVQHNSIGINAAGDAALANNVHGIWINNAASSQILDNLISGNNVHGLYVDGVGSTGTQVLRNTIGTNEAETAAIPNGFDGIRLEAGSSGTTVGSVGNGNVVSGNTQHGVNINSSSGNTIQGNWIGTDSAGTVDLGNTWAGVYSDVFNSSNNLIGGTGVGEGNTVAFNDEGIRLESGTGNAILANSIFSNDSLGIDLSDDGATANDGGDGDSGPNDLLNFPVIALATELAGTVDVEFDLDVPAGTYRVEFFANQSGADPTGNGEGEEFLSAVVVGPGTGLSHSFSGSAGDVLSATATEQLAGPTYASTSEFSAAVTTTGANALAVAVADPLATSYQTALLIDPSANDTDADAESVDEVEVLRPANGTLLDNGDGTYTYTPDKSFVGADPFDYLAMDSGTQLAHHWPMAGDAVDSVGSVDGTLTGTTTVTGAFGDAMSFDEVDDLITYPDLAYAGDFSISFDFKLDDNTGGLFKYAYSHGSINSTNSINIFFNEATHGTDPDVLRTVARDADDTLDNLALQTDIASLVGDGLWHTYVLTVSAASGLEVFLDGVSVASDPTRGTSGVDPTGSLYVGGRYDLNADRYYGGDLDSLQIYDQALSPSEISDLDATINQATATITVGALCAGPDSDLDGLCDAEEDANSDLDSNPATTPGPDTDGDTTPDYLDADDDGDGIPTASENADPNGDGDPRDARDVDWDGEPDYLDLPTGAAVGAVATEQKISSATGGLTAALDDFDYFGETAAPVGDLDGDGVVDLAVGAHLDDDGGTSRGAVHILFLNTDGSVKAEQKISATSGGLVGPLTDYDYFGRSVARLGDLDGDGIGDLAVGAYGDDSGGGGRGAVYVLFLNVDGTVKAEQKISDTVGGLATTLGNGDSFGFALAGIGDLNGDGLVDLAVGADLDDDGGTNRGAVFVLFMNADGTVTAEQKISDLAGGLSASLDDDDSFGGALARIGDLDGDGIEDLAVSAHRDDDGGTDRGAVYVLFLNTDGTVKGEQKISDLAGGLGVVLDNSDYFGRGVGGPGDIDGDGNPDLVVGAYGDDDGGTSQGAVHVLALNTDGTVRTESKISSVEGGLSGPLDDSDFFGAAVAGLGDLDGDGSIGIAVGAYGDDDGGTNPGALYILDLASPVVNVNSSGDAIDTTVGDGICHTGGLNADGHPECTLRAAIAEANASVAIDEIDFAIPAADPGYVAGPSAYWSIAPDSALPSITTDMTIDATTQAGWVANTNPARQALNGTLVIEINGIGAGATTDGLVVDGASAAIRGLVVNRFKSSGINVTGAAENTELRGNYLGTDVSGSFGGFFSNLGPGLVIKNGSSNTIVGGENPDERNLIGDAGGALMSISGAGTDDTIVRGNVIGTRSSGTVSVVTMSTADGVYVGSGPANVNLIDNMISGAGEDGIDLDGVASATIEGNWIGVDVSGNVSLPNAGDGIEIKGGSTSVGIGGGGSKANVISGNGSAGVNLSNVSSGIVIEGNLIGLGADGSTPIGNSNQGIYLPTAGSNITIGGTSAGLGNEIANNAGGVQIDDGVANSILGNSIHDNVGLGIDLAPGAVIGATGNDAADVDSGPNGLLNFPVVTAASELTGAVTVDFDLDAPAGDYRIEVFTNPSGAHSSGHGEGETFEVATTIAHTGSGAESFQVVYSGAVGDMIALTATEEAAGPAYGSTSEFSAVFTAVPAACTDSDGDGLCDLEEDANTDLDSNPATNPGPDTDGDTTPNYLDADDDGDGTATALENADPNTDGDPRDAVDSDHDGQPDYLDRPTSMVAGEISNEQKISALSGGLTGPLQSFDFFGSGAAPIGDLDGDGIVDLAVGAYQDDDGGSSRGAIYVLFLNADGTVRAEQKISDTEGGLIATLDDSDQFGRNVASLGDLDGDGRVELAVGAFRGDDGGSNRGELYVLFLNADGTVRAEQKISDSQGGLATTLGDSDEFGRDVAGVGDIDGDGVNDLAVGASLDDDGGADAGAVYVLLLNNDGTVKGEQKISSGTGGLTGPIEAGDQFGLGLAALGDLDGDGTPDLVVGAHQDDDGASAAGAVYVLFLNADGTVRAEQKISDTEGGLIASLDTSDYFGTGIAALGDLDLDGVVDLAVGATGDDDGAGGAGAVHLLFLNNDGTVKAESKISSNAGGLSGPLSSLDSFGQDIAGLGDLDGDGTIHLAVGAQGDDDGASSAGAVYLLELALDTAATVNSTGDSTDANPGDDVCDTGGTNADGDPECTLRAAIAETSASAEMDTIDFGIPATDPGHNAGVWTISPASAQLDWVNATIDASTQPGWAGTPVIVLDGSLRSGSPTDDGLRVSTDGVTLSDLSVVNWPDDGVHTGNDNVSFERLWVGVLPAGTTAANGSSDMLVYGTAANTNVDSVVMAAAGTDDGLNVDGTTTGTIIRNSWFGATPAFTDLGPVGEGVILAGSADLTITGSTFGYFPNAAIVPASTGSLTVTGSAFGTDLTGTQAMPTAQAIWTDGPGQIVFGGTGGGDGNIVRNTFYGTITLSAGYSGTATILGNSFTGNDALAIELVGGTEDAAGVTANDAGDGDTGPNGLLNYPVLITPASGVTNLGVDLDVAAGDYRIEVFTNPTDGADPSGYGEGESFLHAETVTHTGAGVESFTLTGVPATIGADVLTATATADLGGGSFGATSEFSAAVTVCDDPDGDGLCTRFESLFGDTDGDTIANELDSDDDGDGALTAAENADPNSDGDPRDAVDSDHDGQPDYLDLPTISTVGFVSTEQKISDVAGGLAATLDDGDFFGRVVTSIGDLDGDGIVDVAVGSSKDDDGGTDRGAVHVLLLNADGSVKVEQKISSTVGGLTGPLADGDRFGTAVADLGDVDGDGVTDLIAGALQDGDGGVDAGAAYVLFLNTDGTVKAEQKISALSGGLTGLDAGDEFGISANGLGDLDSDGINDVAVGARGDDDGSTDAGAAYVLFLNADGTVKAEQKISALTGGLTGPLGAGDQFGESVAGVGDVDGDGVGDLVVGANFDDDGGADVGAVYVLFLNADGTLRSEQKISALSGGLTGPLDPDDGFGGSAGAVGDLDGDGIGDLAIGAPSDDDGGTDRGAVHVLNLNSDGTVKAERKISTLSGGLTGPLLDGDKFSSWVTGLGDLDGDGTINLAVGAFLDDDGGNNRGAVYVLDLSPDPLVIVNSTGDAADAVPGDHGCDTGATKSGGDPECTLRAAIQEANASSEVDRIHFAIPATDPGHSAGVWTVGPVADLPAIAQPVTLDASSQTGYAGAPVVEIDGTSLASTVAGLRLGAGAAGTEVRGLAIGGFPAVGIEISADSVQLVGNHIGVGAGGSTDDGNVGHGVLVNGSALNVTIGGAVTVDRNVIGYNGGAGISLDTVDTAVIIGNHIGVQLDGTTGAANATGVSVGNALGVRIGSTALGERNLISANTGDGVTVTTGSLPAIVGNSIHTNGGLGIDHDDDGVTANDGGDADAVPNAPVLDTATDNGGISTVDFLLDVAAGTYVIDFYLNPAGGDASGFGEGEQHVSSVTLVHDGSGSKLFSHAFAAAPGGTITATSSASGPPVSATSEFSNRITTAALSAVTFGDAGMRRSNFAGVSGLDPASPAPGVAGVALDVAGGTERAVGPSLDITSGAGSGNLSLSAWVRLDTAGGQHAVISKQDRSSNPLYELAVDGTTNEGTATVRLSGTAVVARGGSIATATWHHLAAAWDGAELVLIVDGVEVDREAAVGVLGTDVTTRTVVGNRADTSRPLDGRIDHVQISHVAVPVGRVATHHRQVGNHDTYLTVGAEQTSPAGSWAVSAAQTRSGGFSLAAPETLPGEAAAWAVATAIDEPGAVFETWWWTSSNTGVDLAAGTRAGLSPVDQYEAALTSGSGWELRRRTGATETVDAAAAGTPSVGTWMKVEVWTDHLNASRILIDGVEVTGWTAQGSDLISGSLGLRAGVLGSGEQWFVDDARARRLVTPEPVASLGPLDRN